MSLLRHASRSQKASVLALSLWMVVVLSVIATSLAFDVQVNSKLAMLQKQQLMAYHLAKAGVAVGMTHLQNDAIIDYQENANQVYDAMSDVWAQPGRKEKEIEVELGRGTYETEVVDEESKININVANQKLLKAMLEYYGYEPPDSDEIANAIQDWRDPDDMCLGASSEKENEHYSALLGQRIRNNTDAEELIYQCPNENFLSVEELLDVCGIDPVVYYGHDPESDEAKENNIRDSIAMGKYVRETKKRDSKREGLPLKDIITVRGSGKVNLNTASEEVLTIMMYAGNNCTDMESARTAAQSIVEFRGTGRKGHAPDPDDAFHSLADVAKVPGLPQQAIQGLSSSGGLGVQIWFSSETFNVTGIGRVGSVKKTVTAIVQRRMDIYNPDDSRLASNQGGSKHRGGFASRGGPRRKNSNEEDNYIRIPAIRVQQWLE